MNPWLYLLLLGLAVGSAIALLMGVVGGMRPGEFRERLIASALHTYTHEGFSIPGVSRGPLAGLVLWLLRYDGADAPRLGRPWRRLTLFTSTS
jgi:hypothetical protein